MKDAQQLQLEIADARTGADGQPQTSEQLIEHIIALYGAELTKANDFIAEQKRANDELFRIKQRVVIANRELMRKNGDLLQFTKRILAELPTKRDWLDPDLEKFGRALIKQT